ncbi:MAG: hypothetical protein PF503_00145 [Desulfobacula sp.]|jgi:hypothetical protein|nr:hypothetical protein [Desulfobacula sp.]
MAIRTRVNICQRSVGEHTLPGHGPVMLMKRPVRTRMKGVVGLKPPATRLMVEYNPGASNLIGSRAFKFCITKILVIRRSLNSPVWERGAGRTLACGTGACAALVAASLTGRVQDSAIVHLDGGDLDIHWDNKTNHIFKTGTATLVFEGRIRI